MDDNLELNDQQFQRIRDILRNGYGISMGVEKRTLVFSRLRPLLRQKGFGDFDAYLKYLAEDKTGEATSVFINRLTTNHTYFMREPEHMELLAKRALPWIEENFGKTKDLRLWCAACSSGEEAYTLQMVVSDYFENKPGWNLEILATDISERVLQQAYAGIYSNESLKALPSDWLSKYFKRYDDENMIARDEIKRLITFRRYNLNETKMPFKKPFQVIFCRNVMIYFDNTTREALVTRMYDALEKDGFFFVGHSESLSNIRSDFEFIRPAAYRK